jgi:hypothetical protein
MGDPAEENDPPPESQAFLTKGMGSVNCQLKKNRQKNKNSVGLGSWGESPEPGWSSGDYFRNRSVTCRAWLCHGLAQKYRAL